MACSFFFVVFLKCNFFLFSFVFEFLHASGDASTKIAFACCFWINLLTADADFAGLLPGLGNC